jgi:hypothetical protein
LVRSINIISNYKIYCHKEKIKLKAYMMFEEGENPKDDFHFDKAGI